MWNSRLHSFTLLTYELLKRSTIERNRPLPSKNSIRRFQQSIMRIKVRTIVESDLEHVVGAHPSSSKPPFPVCRQTHFQGVGSIAISIRIDREHVEHGLWRGRCVSHTGWSKSHAIRIPIAVSIQFARHFGHPVSWTTRIPLILNHLGPSNDDRAQPARLFVSGSRWKPRSVRSLDLLLRSSTEDIAVTPIFCILLLLLSSKRVVIRKISTLRSVFYDSIHFDNLTYIPRILEKRKIWNIERIEIYIRVTLTNDKTIIIIWKIATIVDPILTARRFV